MKYLIYVLSLVIITVSCNGDCENVKVGDIEPPDFYSDYIVPQHGDIIIYKNQSDETMSFTTDVVDMEFKLPTKTTSNTPSVQGPITCFEYLGLSAPLLQFSNERTRTLLTSQMIVFGPSEDSITYHFKVAAGSTQIIDNTQVERSAHIVYSITRDHYIDEDHNESTFTTLPIWQIRGKIFADVWVIQNPNAKLYFSRGIGIIAFRSVTEDLWLIE